MFNPINPIRPLHLSDIRRGAGAAVLIAMLWGAGSVIAAPDRPDWDRAWQPGEDRVDPHLQAMLEARMFERPEWRRLARNHKLGVCTVDLNGHEPRYAHINGNHMMYAASLPKTAIMLGVYAYLLPAVEAILEPMQMSSK
jgi:hypothetical protein